MAIVRTQSMQSPLLAVRRSSTVSNRWTNARRGARVGRRRWNAERSEPVSAACLIFCVYHRVTRHAVVRRCHRVQGRVRGGDLRVTDFQSRLRYDDSNNNNNVNEWLVITIDLRSKSVRRFVEIIMPRSNVFWGNALPVRPGRWRHPRAGFRRTGCVFYIFHPIWWYLYNINCELAVAFPRADYLVKYQKSTNFLSFLVLCKFVVFEHAQQ